MHDGPQELPRWLDIPLQRVSADPLERWHARVYVAPALMMMLCLGMLALAEAAFRGPLNGRTLAISTELLLCGLSLVVTAATGQWRLAAGGVLATLWMMLVGLDSMDTANDPAIMVGLAMWIMSAVSILGRRAALPALLAASLGRALSSGLLLGPVDTIEVTLYLTAVTNMAVLAGMAWGIDFSREQAMRHALERARDASTLAETQRRFLATMGHEIRTPMNGVLNLSQLLGQTRLDRDQEMLVRTLQRSGHSLMSVLNDVLDFSRLEAGADALEQRPIDLRELLAEVRQLLAGTAAEAGLALRCHVHDGVPAHVSGDPIRIRQIVTNLVSNAIASTPSGEVTVTVASVPAGIEIVVSDTGEGLSPEALSRVFDPFIEAGARQPGSSGLGLAICERLCRAMGGTITAGSEPGAGTTFTVTLPLPPAAVPPRQMPARHLPRRLGARVLIAEDHAINQIVARRLLEQLGVEATVVDDGYAAVSLLAAGERFDLVLMDLYMPNLDGFAATRAIRSLPGPARQTPIVALSASTLPGDRARSLEAGVDGHLSKPIDPQALDAALERWLPSAPVAAREPGG